MKDLTNWTNDIKIPGALWVIAIVAVIVLAETYIPSETTKRFVELLVIVGPMAAKFFNVGDEKTNALLDIIEALQSRMIRAPRSALPSGESAPAAAAAPEVTYVSTEALRPNRAVRYWLG